MEIESILVGRELKSGFLSVSSRIPAPGKYSHGFRGTLTPSFHRLTLERRIAWQWMADAGSIFAGNIISFIRPSE